MASTAPTVEQTDEHGQIEAPPAPAASDAPRFSIHPLRTAQSTLYEDAVLNLIDAQQHAEIDPETGKPEIMAITILIPAEKKARSRHLRDFREAANRHGKTARIRGEDEQADGSVAIDFTITERTTRNRKPVNGAS